VSIVIVDLVCIFLASCLLDVDALLFCVRLGHIQSVLTPVLAAGTYYGILLQ
jgi:hypothetical protein